MVQNTGSAHAVPVGAVSIYTIDSTGALKETIVNTVNFGAQGTAGATTELTHYSTTVAGLTFTPASGDRLVVEYGFNAFRTSGGGAVNGGSTVYFDGPNAITVDNTVISNPATFVTCPTTLLFPTAAAIPPFPTIVRQAVQRAAVW